MGRKTKASHICPFKKTIIMEEKKMYILYNNIVIYLVMDRIIGYYLEIGFLIMPEI